MQNLMKAEDSKPVTDCLPELERLEAVLKENLRKLEKVGQSMDKRMGALKSHSGAVVSRPKPDR